MKSIITIALLLSVMIGYGQTQAMPLSTGRGFYGFLGERLPAVDTPAVFFLVTDTAHRVWVNTYITFDTTMRGKGLNLGKFVHDTTDYGIRNEASFLVKGFVAREKRGDQWNESFWMEPVDYLDADKQPLPKSYIIWQTKPRP